MSRFLLDSAEYNMLKDLMLSVVHKYETIKCAHAPRFLSIFPTTSTCYRYKFNGSMPRKCANRTACVSSSTDPFVTIVHLCN